MKTKKKSKFLTFCFSMMPGAAQMYMGFMKMGVSLMALFILIIIFAVWLNQGAIAALCVITWFYSFFQANHLASLDDEDFREIEDEYLFGIGSLSGIEGFVKEHNKWIAVLLIFAGACLLWESMSNLMYSVLPDSLSFIPRIMRRISNYVPSMVIGCGIIDMGVRMISGRKEEPRQDESDSNTGRRGEPWQNAVFSTGRKEESWRKDNLAGNEQEVQAGDVVGQIQEKGQEEK